MLKIGWAKRDVSTDKPVMLKGQYYARISKGVLDPILVTALTVENGGDYVIFLSTDFTGTPNGFLKAICQKVKEKNSEIDTSKIIMNATHCHTAPVLTLDGKCDWSDKNLDFPHDGVDIADPIEYAMFFIDECAKAVCESFLKREDGYISYGYGYAAVANHRRVVYDTDLSETKERKEELKRSGTAKMYGNTELPDFSGYESGADHMTNFMFTFDKNHELTGAIVNIPCPSQCLEIEWYVSADYWHEVRSELNNRFGKKINILPQCAAAGDQSPRILHYFNAQDRRFKLKFSDMELKYNFENPSELFNRKDIAVRICDSFCEVLSWAKKEQFGDLPVVHTSKTVELDRFYVSEEYYNECRQKYEELTEKLTFVSTDDKEHDLKVNTGRLGAIDSMKYGIARYEEQQTSKYVDTEIHTVRIGEIAFATNQFELYMDYQHRIQARSPFKQTFIVELTAQPNRISASYLPTKRAVEGKGYSAVMTSCRVSPKGGDKLVEETLKELNKIADNDLRG